MENSEEKEDCSAEDIRKKKLELKLRKIKLRRSLNQKRMLGPSSIHINALYEIKMQKLRTNNKALAKELADKKIEISQLYSEVVLLKAELQEANERALRLGDKNYEKFFEQEVERRLKDIGEPLTDAVNHATNTVIGVVDAFSKIKLLSARFNSNRSSSSTISLPRSSLSRTPLGCGGNSSSPCQSVRPMVGGYVLQPAKVAIEKLDDVWQARLKARIQARETQLDMSSIGEHSLSVDEANASNTSEDLSLNTSHSNEEDSTTMNVSGNDMEEDTSPVSPSAPVRGRRERQRNKNQAAAKSPLSGRNVSPTANVSPLQNVDAEEPSETMPDNKAGSPAAPPQEKDDDPLEGPSWWYSETSHRGRGRGRPRSRGGKRGRPSTKSARLSSAGSRMSRSSVGNTRETASEGGQEKTTSNIETANEGASNTPEDVSELPDSPKASADLSYLASPATMLTRLENLEEKAGRRSKSKSKGRSLKVSGAIVDSMPKQQHEVTDAVLGSESEKRQESSFKMPLPVSDSNCFIQDSDLTCIVDESMDMTEPISKILSQAAAELRAPKESQHQNASGDKKFFKNDTASQLQTLAMQGKTPFDLSLMDDTYMAIPAYSSQKTVEKENMPPPAGDNTKTKNADQEKEAVSLRRISIILEDVMKSAELCHSLQEVAVSSPTYQMSLNSSKEKCDSMDDVDPAEEGVGVKASSRKRKTLKYSLYGSPNEEEDEDTDDNWSPKISKKGRVSESKRSSQKSRKVSVSKKRGTKSEIVVSLAKGKRRKNKSESGISLTQATTSVSVKASDDYENIKESRKSETVSSPSQDGPGNTLARGLNECYVKICRTPVCESSKPTVDEEDFEMPDELPDFAMLLKDAEEMDDVGAAKSENQEETESDSNSIQILEDETEQPKESDAATCDHVVPGQFKTTVDIHEEDSKECEKNDGDVRGSEAETESIPDCNSQADTDATSGARRRRGAAMKVSSFKEPSLNSKMRNPESKKCSGAKPKINRKSGVKFAAS